MFFFRSLNNPSGTARPLRTIRMLCVTALGAYPAGALLRALGPGHPLTDIGGLALILLSLGCAAAVAGSRVSRIAAEERGRLDEYEMHLRASAMEHAYSTLAAIVALAVIYIAIASDAGLWVPTGYEQWSGVFWGVFLIASLLPATILAFRLKPGEIEEEAA
jgi:hypothetical protein